jgi:hypothetical protein
VTLFDFLSLKNDVNVPSKIAGSGSESGSISQKHGSEDPDPPQNVMDPEHWLEDERGFYWSLNEKLEVHD